MLAYLHICLIVYFHTCIFAYLRTCKHTNMHYCILAYLSNCISTYMLSCVLAWLQTCILAYLHIRILVYLHTCVLAYLQTCILVYLHACSIDICIGVDVSGSISIGINHSLVSVLVAVRRVWFGQLCACRHPNKSPKSCLIRWYKIQRKQWESWQVQGQGGWKATIKYKSCW